MSSHHFVREGQEPALFILGDISFSRVEGLLEWAPTILVSDAMIEKVLAWGVRIDAIICRPDAQDSIAERLREQQVVDLLVASAEHSVATAAQYLLTRNQHQLTIVTGSFEEIRLPVEMQLKQVSVVVLDPEVRWIPLSGELRKWVHRDTKFVIRPTQMEDLKVVGLRREGAFWVPEAEGIVTISSPEFTWVGEFL